MKKVTILLCLAFVLLAGINAQAQIKMPKTSDLSKNIPTDALSSELVKALNPGSGLDISADQLLKLEGNNKSYVNDLMKIFSGSGTDSEKNKLAEGKQKERKDFVSSLLGDGKAAKYYKLIKPQVEPLIKKYALAKFLL